MPDDPFPLQAVNAASSAALWTAHEGAAVPARLAYGEAATKIEVDLPVGADVLPEQRGQAAPVGRAQQPFPFGLGQDVLQH